MFGDVPSVLLDGFCGCCCGGGGVGGFGVFGFAGVDYHLDKGFDLGAEEEPDEADEDEECDDEDGEVGSWCGHFGMMFVDDDEDDDFTEHQSKMVSLFFLIH